MFLSIFWTAYIPVTLIILSLVWESGLLSSQTGTRPDCLFEAAGDQAQLTIRGSALRWRLAKHH